MLIRMAAGLLRNQFQYCIMPKQKKESKKPETSVDKKAKSPEKEKPKNLKEQKPEKQKKLVVVDKDGEEAQPKLSKLKVELGDGKFPNNPIRISSWNINGVRASTKHESTRDYINSEKFDVICLNELKITEDDFIKENMGSKFSKGYFQYLNFCKEKAGYSGVGILSKVKPIKVNFDLGIHKHDQEGRTITAEFEKFNLVACYVPNAGEKLARLDYRTKEWDVDFQNYLAQLKKKKPTILCGDLNVAHEEIDLANPKTNSKTAGFTPEEREGFTGFLKQGWADTFRHLHPKEQKFSYFSARFQCREKNLGWRLDYFVVNKESLNGFIESDINKDVKGSDHVPIECLIDLQKL